MVTNGYNITIDMIDWSCPADLEVYNKAYQIKMKTIDNYIHKAFGTYYISGLVTVLDNALSKNPRAEYVKESVLEELGLTEEEKTQRLLDKYIQDIEERKRKWDSMYNRG